MLRSNLRYKSCDFFVNTNDKLFITCILYGIENYGKRIQILHSGKYYYDSLRVFCDKVACDIFLSIGMCTLGVRVAHGLVKFLSCVIHIYNINSFKNTFQWI